MSETEAPTPDLGLLRRAAQHAQGAVALIEADRWFAAAEQLRRGWRALAAATTTDPGRSTSARDGLQGLRTPAWAADDAFWAELERLAVVDADAAAGGQPPSRAERRIIERHLTLLAQAVGRAERAVHGRRVCRWLRRNRAGWATAVVLIVAAVAFRPTSGARPGLPPAGPAAPPPQVPDAPVVPLEALATPHPPGRAWDAPGSATFGSSLTIALPAPTSASGLRISVDNNDRYELRAQLGSTEVGRVLVSPEPLADGGMQIVDVDLGRLEGAPFDRLIVTPVQGDGSYSVGFLELRPTAP